MPHGRRSLFVSTVALCGVFLVSGCALPPAIAIASYAATGISYLTSGKSVSDHVFSAMVEQDCALLRVVMGEDICRAQGDQPEDGVVVASAEGKKPWDIEPAAGSSDDNAANENGSGDYFEGPIPPQETALARADEPTLKGVLLEGLALGTEIFAHDPARVDAPENMRMILKVDGYAKISATVEGVRLNGKYYAISDILV